MTRRRSESTRRSWLGALTSPGEPGTHSLTHLLHCAAGFEADSTAAPAALLRYFDVKAKDLIRKLLASDVSQRLGCLRNGGEDVKNHKWFGRLNWDAVYACKLPPPFVPEVRSADDTRNFDKYPDSTNKPLAPLTPEQRELFAEFDRL